MWSMGKWIPFYKSKTPWINAQCQSMSIKIMALVRNSSQCQSMPPHAYQFLGIVFFDFSSKKWFEIVTGLEIWAKIEHSFVRPNLINFTLQIMRCQNFDRHWALINWVLKSCVLNVFCVWLNDVVESVFIPPVPCKVIDGLHLDSRKCDLWEMDAIHYRKWKSHDILQIGMTV